MKKAVVVLIGLIFLLSAACALAAGPNEATTDDGRKVILHPDGTWEYKDAPQNLESGAGNKPEGATKLYKSKKGFYEIWVNPDMWKMSPTAEGEEAEYNFTHKSGDAYAVIIAERIPIPTETLKDVALENARAVAPDAKITSQNYVEVNGVQVLNLQIDGTIQGIKFTYFGYYWGGKAGALQVITFTGQTLFEELKPDMKEFLDGLVITKP